MGYNTPPVKSSEKDKHWTELQRTKDRQVTLSSEEVSDDVQAYLDAGGVITQCKSVFNPSDNYRPVNIHSTGDY